ncbi:MAG: ribonuclease Y [Actinomycetes bacterium]
MLVSGGVLILLLLILVVVLLVVATVTVLLLGRTRRPLSDRHATVTADVDRTLLLDREAAEVRARLAAEADELRARVAQDMAVLRAQEQADLDAVRQQVERSARLAADARVEAEAELEEVRRALRDQRADVERRETRLADREVRLDADREELAARDRSLAARAAALQTEEQRLSEAEAQQVRGLERVAGLTSAAARAELVESMTARAKREAALTIREIERVAQEEGEGRAREIITTAIQRLASEQTAESVVSVVHLPGDEMKGRIIGREGRNIRAFESVTGVNLIIDDTPEAVLLSCFDPVRREVGRLTLEALVLDGRIHPHRIEEVFERSRVEVEQACQRAGEGALVDLGITDLHPDLVLLLGRLRYRTSYGQNVLGHLLESAHIAGMMAAELGLDPVLLQRCALLHDIGKALTHEVGGSHALVGAELARKYGECDDVVHAIEAHHNEVEPGTLEAILTQAADAVSGGRPGARRESLESYVHRLERLEEIARTHEGVDKVFAMQAGRELRVMVLPEQVDDIAAQVMARDIVKQIEEELTYPGQIRVTVVRESRASETAR